MVWRWLRTSKEHTNLTYDLTPVNRQHLAWWVAEQTSIPVETAHAYILEIEHDEALQEHVRSRTRAHVRGRYADETVRLHKRLGWYALARATRPQLIVETGTDKGLGALVFAAALQRNGSGKVVTIDINHESGYLIGPPYDNLVERVIGDSVTVLRESPAGVDLFLHDSLHTPEHELAEFRAVEPKLNPGALVLSDYAHASRALATWAEETGRRFAFFGEIPDKHWYAGEGIGLATDAKGKNC